MLKPMTDWWGPPKVQTNKCKWCRLMAGMTHLGPSILGPSFLSRRWTAMRFTHGPELSSLVSTMCNQCQSLVPMTDPLDIIAMGQSLQPGPTPRTPVPPAVRRAVFERDRYTCQACGASGDDPGVQLVIDHKKPLKRGGTNEMSNLQTLCSKCNTEKGDKNTGYGDSVAE